MPERDGLLGETKSDNVRHVIARGVFLDYFLNDHRIDSIIGGWVNRTPLKDKVQQVASALAQISTLAKGPWDEVPWDEETGFLSAIDNNDEISRTTVKQASALVRSFLDEMRSFPRSDEFQGVANEIIDLVARLELPYQWLVIEVAQVYFARLFIDDFSWRYTDNLEVEDTADSHLAPELMFEFRTRGAETVGEAISRVQSLCEKAVEELTRFVEPLPRGKMPKITRPTVKKYAEWLYRMKVARESIRSIAAKDFPDESDRRKDVRDGIKEAERLLSLGRCDLPRPDMSSWQVQ